MVSLSMVEAKLPPGFRFHPRDDELVCDYLRPRASAASARVDFHGFPTMVDVDLNKCEPWDLPGTACIRGKEWYFFTVRDRKYATGQRTNRATLSGYWKATGKDRHVSRKGVLVGMRKTLVFYQGRAPKGKKTEWVMHEFRMEGHGDPPDFNNSFKEDWVLCRVFYKSRRLCPKMSSESCDEDAGSSSLPQLTDSHMVTYDQAPINLEGLEQVPCFSNFAAIQAAPPQLTPMERNLPDLTSCLNTISCDKKVLKVVLSHFTKLEDSHVIPESCFSESAIPSLWNPFASF